MFQRFISGIGFLLLFGFSYAFAQDTLDDSFFTESVATNTNQLENKKMFEELDKESVGFSGMVKSTTSYNVYRDLLLNKTNSWSNNTLSTQLEGEMFLDIRLKKGIKAFLDLDMGYSPTGAPVVHNFYQPVVNPLTMSTTNSNITLYETNNMAIDIKQFYVDVNIDQKIYFRGGKQVLKWGRCYLWNPADLVNVQQINFFNLTQSRDGSYGLSMQSSLGTFNVYGFIDANNVSLPEDLGVAGKIEFLVDKTEFSAAARVKKNYHSIYALDFSSRVFQIDIRGEASLTEFSDKGIVSRNITTYTIPFGPSYDITNYSLTNSGQHWVPKVSLGFTKTFDFMEIKDRISLTGEFFYNSSGYTYNWFSETAYRQMPVGYVPYYNSMFYAACFTSFNEFINSDLTLNINGIANLNDGSFVLMPGLSYSPIDHFILGWDLIAYCGPDNTEFTFMKNGLTTDVTLTLSF